MVTYFRYLSKISFSKAALKNYDLNAYCLYFAKKFATQLLFEMNYKIKLNWNKKTD